jgi:hypothetical protein
MLACVLAQHLLFSTRMRDVLTETFVNAETGREERWCRQWLSTYLKVQSLTYGSALVIVALNLVFRKLLKPLVVFEHEWYGCRVTYRCLILSRSPLSLRVSHQGSIPFTVWR